MDRHHGHGSWTTAGCEDAFDPKTGKYTGNCRIHIRVESKPCPRMTEQDDCRIVTQQSKGKNGAFSEIASLKIDDIQNPTHNATGIFRIPLRFVLDMWIKTNDPSSRHPGVPSSVRPDYCRY